MKDGIAMNRAQRLERLVRLQAPCSLLQNEVRLAMSEYMTQDIEVGIGGGLGWVSAAWALVASLTIAVDERDALRLEVRRLKRDAKKKASP